MHPTEAESALEEVCVAANYLLGILVSPSDAIEPRARRFARGWCAIGPEHRRNSASNRRVTASRASPSDSASCLTLMALPLL